MNQGKFFAGRKKGRKYIVVIQLFLLSLLYWLGHFRWVALLFDKGRLGLDAEIFSCMGAFCKKGMIPYKDCFDHKGPVMVLINYVMQSFANPKVGELVVTVILLTTSLCAVYKILGLFYEGKTQIIITMCSLIIFRLYGVGGLTETYCLPFLMWSIYFIVYFMKNVDEKEHNKWFAFFYGITFAVCLLTRVTNALVLCCTIFIVLLILVKNKQWKNIIENIIFFVIGTILICLPFIVYFIRKQALYDMVYGTIIYNVLYATGSQQHFVLLDYLKEIIYYLHLFFVAAFVGIVHAKYCKKDKALSYLVVFTSFCCIAFQLMSLMYTHYMIAYIPILFVAIGLLKDLLLNIKAKKLMIVVLSICGVLLAFKSIRIYQDSYITQTSNDRILFREDACQIKNIISDKDKDSVIAYNVAPYFYLATDLQPCYKYFIAQDWQSSASSSMRKELNDFFSSGRAKYIVLNANGENVFDALIAKNYHEIYSNKNLKLLKKN